MICDTSSILAKAQALFQSSFENEENQTSNNVSMSQSHDTYFLSERLSDNNFHLWSKIQIKLYYRQLESICIMFKNADIDFIVLKGAPLLESLYDKSPLRISGDVDILVRFNDLRKTCETLIANCYVNEESGKDIVSCMNEDSHLLMGMNHLRVFNLENKTKTALPVELHYALASTYPVDLGIDCNQYSLNHLELFSHTRTIKTSKLEFRILDWNYEFLSLLYHFSIHARHSFRKVLRCDENIGDLSHLLVEIALYWIHNYSHIDIDAIWYESIRNGRGYAVYLPITIVNAAFDLNIPQRPYKEINIIKKGQDTIRLSVEQIADIAPRSWFNDLELKMKFKKMMRKKYLKILAQKDFILLNPNRNTVVPINYLKGLRYSQMITSKKLNACEVLHDHI